MGEQVTIKEVYSQLISGGQNYCEIHIPDTNYTIQIQLIEQTPVEILFQVLCKEYPHLKSDKGILHGELILVDVNIILSVVWKWCIYHNNKVILCVPKYTLSNLLAGIELFNEKFIKITEFYLKTGNRFELVACELETFENLKITKKDDVVFILGYADFAVNTIVGKNKRRLYTQFKKINSMSCVILISSTTMKYFDNEQFDDFELFKISETPAVNYSTLIDYCTSINELVTQEGLDDLVELVVSGVEQKQTFYMCLNLEVNKLKYIERALKSAGMIVSRKEQSGAQVVINSDVTCKLCVLEEKYDCYVYSIHDVDCIDLIEYFKHVITNNDINIYIDETIVDRISKQLNKLQIIEKSETRRFKITDTSVFDKYSECEKSISNDFDFITVVDKFIRLGVSDKIRRMNLSSLSISDYKIIREYIIHTLDKNGYSVKTCQLVYPCSPVDRFRKLNSLPNKISSFDYRCDATCEVFRDYTIGIVIWSELFSNRGEIDYSSLVNNNYMYQTTSGKWKCTTIEFKKNKKGN